MFGGHAADRGTDDRRHDFVTLLTLIVIPAIYGIVKGWGLSAAVAARKMSASESEAKLGVASMVAEIHEALRHGDPASAEVVTHVSSWAEILIYSDGQRHSRDTSLAILNAMNPVFSSKTSSIDLESVGLSSCACLILFPS